MFPSGYVKLTDFGLARTFAPADATAMMTKAVCTRWYKAPEIALGVAKYGTEIDVWSAGCVMAELILRKPAFPGSSDINLLTRICEVLGTPNAIIQQSHPHIGEELARSDGTAQLSPIPTGGRNFAKQASPRRAGGCRPTGTHDVLGPAETLHSRGGAEASLPQGRVRS